MNRHCYKPLQISQDFLFWRSPSEMSLLHGTENVNILKDTQFSSNRRTSVRQSNVSSRYKENVADISERNCISNLRVAKKMEGKSVSLAKNKNSISLGNNDAVKESITVATARDNVLVTILESEHKLAMSSQSQKLKNISKIHTPTEMYDSEISIYQSPKSNRPRQSPLKRSRRKSVAETIFPFDLNDPDYLVKKLKLTENKYVLKECNAKASLRTPCRFSVGSPTCSRKSQNLLDPTCGSPISSQIVPVKSRVNNVGNSRVNSTPILDISTQTTIKCNKTILFDDDVLSSRTQHSISEILLESSIESLISTMESTDVHCSGTDHLNNVSHKPFAEVNNQLSFQNFSTSSCKSMLLKAQNEYENLNGASTVKTPQHNFLKGDENQDNASKKEPKEIVIEDIIDADHDYFPPTQPASILILRDVVAYVEVRDGCDNRSDVIGKLLQALGADVRRRFTIDVTHVVFKDGSLATFRKAISKRIHLVSSLWVDACRQKGERVCEAKYPSCSAEQYSSPLMPAKLRKLKSMQPRELSEEMSRAAARLKRRQKGKIPDETMLDPIILNLQLRSVSQEELYSPLFGINHLLTPQGHSSSESSNEGDFKSSQFNTPLATRLYNRFMSPSESEKRRSISRKIIFPKSDLCELLEGDILEGDSQVAINKIPNLKITSGVSSTEEEDRADDGVNDVKRQSRRVKIGPQKKSTSNNVVSAITEESVNGSSKLTDRQVGQDSNFKHRSRRQKLYTVDEMLTETLIVPLTPERPNQLMRLRRSVYMRDAKRERCGRGLSPVVVSASSSAGIFSLNQQSQEEKKKNSDFSESESNRFILLPKPRRSTEEFVQDSNGGLVVKSQKLMHRISCKDTFDSPCFATPGLAHASICVTSVNAEIQSTVTSIVNSLGGFRLVDSVDESTSHVISGGERRTLNLLAGVSRGCWILSCDWLYESLEKGTWAAEEPYEMFMFCPGAKKNRLLREKERENFVTKLFSNMGSIFVMDKCSPPTTKLKELLKLNGATLVSTTRSADVVVGGKRPLRMLVHVTEKWVLDTIQHQRVFPVEDYVTKEDDQHDSSVSITSTM